MVNYSVSELNVHEEFVAHYRRRPPDTNWVDSGWGPHLEEQQFVILEDIGNNSRSGMSHACGGEYSFSERYHIWASESPTGVDLEILHSQTRGDTETTVEEVISLPFRKSLIGRKGKIEYRAEWQEATPANRLVPNS